MRESNPALDSAIAFLKSRDRSRFEVVSHLRQQGHEEVQIEATVTWLESKRAIDDERLAKMILDSASGVGPSKLDQKLKSRGLDTSVLESSLVAPESQFESMRIWIEKRRFRKGDEGKAYRFLVSKGFDPDLVESTIHSVFESMEPIDA